MAKQRYINTKFWSDGYIDDLDPSEKLLFLYLLTNERTNLCGIYEVPVKLIAVETGIDKHMVDKILARFESDKKIGRHESWIYVVNAQKQQNTNSPMIKKAIEKEMALIPTSVIDTLSIPYRYHRSNIDRDIDRDINKDIITSSQAQTATNEFSLKPKKAVQASRYGNPEVRAILKLAKDLGFTSTQAQGEVFAAGNLVKQFGYKPVRSALEDSQKLIGIEFAPQVSSIRQLKEKWLPLTRYLESQGTSGVPKEIMEAIEKDAEGHKNLNGWSDKEKQELIEKRIKRYKDTGSWR